MQIFLVANFNICCLFVFGKHFFAQNVGEICKTLFFLRFCIFALSVTSRCYLEEINRKFHLMSSRIQFPGFRNGISESQNKKGFIAN